MDTSRMEALWLTVKPSLQDLKDGKMLDENSIESAKAFCAEMTELIHYFNEALPGQIYGRRCRVEAGKVIYDPEGDRVTFRGLFGAVWTKPLDWKPQPKSIAKHIAPFD